MHFPKMDDNVSSARLSKPVKKAESEQDPECTLYRKVSSTTRTSKVMNCHMISVKLLQQVEFLIHLRSDNELMMNETQQAIEQLNEERLRSLLLIVMYKCIACLLF